MEMEERLAGNYIRRVRRYLSWLSWLSDIILEEGY